MTTIVARFADLCRADPGRLLIHLPATGTSLTASDIWDAHLAMPSVWTRPALVTRQLIVSAAGNHPAIAALLPGVPCDRSGDDAARRGHDARRDSRRSRTDSGPPPCVLPAAIAADERIGATSRHRTCQPGLQLLRRKAHSAAPLPGDCAVEADVRIDRCAEGDAHHEAQLVADGTQIVAAMGIHATDTQIAAIPLSHSYGLGVLLMPLLSQGTAIVLRDSFIPPSAA